MRRKDTTFSKNTQELSKKIMLKGAVAPLKVKIKAKGLYEPLKVHFVHTNGLRH